MPNICGRWSTSFTGRPSFRAAMAASGTCDHTEPLQPKPPPTKGQMTRTLSFGTPSVLASVCCAPLMYWVVSYTVKRSPCQRAMEAWGSMGLWCCMGVV